LIFPFFLFLPRLPLWFPMRFFYARTTRPGAGKLCVQPSTYNLLNLHVNMQDNTTLAPQAAAFAATPDVNLSTDPKRMALIKIWDAMFRGARKYVEPKGLMRQGMKLSAFDWCLDFHKAHDVKLHSGAGVGMVGVAQFILGQKDIRDSVPFLINRDNVI
jgi:hypothetical protein